MAIGPAHLFPQYPFSTTTAIAIVGFSLGAKATKIEWSFSWYVFPATLILFSAVPVLPQISNPSTFKFQAVPTL